MAKNKTVGDVMSETYSISDKGDTWGCQPHSLKIGQLLLSLLNRDPPHLFGTKVAHHAPVRVSEKKHSPPVLFKQKFFYCPGRTHRPILPISHMVLV